MLAGIWGALKALGGIFTLANKIADAIKSRRERAQGRMEGELDGAKASVELQKNMAKADGAGPRSRDDAANRLRDGTF